MRFLIGIDRDWRVTVSAPAVAEGWTRTRQMRRLDAGAAGLFPAPPAGELADADAEHQALPSGGDPGPLVAAYRAITARHPEAPVAAFGRYLFDCLLGQKLWAEIQAAAAGNGTPTIELALTWSPSQRALHRLNWEMLRSPAGFLAAGTGSAAVAITRCVAGATAPARQVDTPSRMLFVVGTSLTDPKIRPGAEYLGLLRRLKREGRTIHARLLENATPSRIQQAISTFRPDIVHFVCHGNVDPRTGLGYLELAADEEDREADRRRGGEQLVGYLSLGDVRPAIVVLSTCFSASAEGPSRMLGAHETAPLAAELVMGGIPVVLGMAGRVSDLACRLFTRRFGECLIRGDPLVVATADARRATFLEGNQPHRSPDWALPAVFLSEAVGSDYAPVRPDAGDRARRIADLVTAYKVERGPVFCGRDDFLQAYDRLLEPSGPRVLGAFVRQHAPGYGRTRLLEELTIQALRDGNIPVLVSARGIREPPRTLPEFGDALLDAIVAARQAFDLDPPIDSQLLLLRDTGAASAGRPGLDPFISYELSVNQQVTARAVRLALAADLSALAAEARRRHDLAARVVVLLDEVDAYGQAAIALFDVLLDGFGLGTREEPVPVALTFSLGGVLDHYLRPLVERAPTIAWLELAELAPFRNDGEDMMAYELVLLTPSFNPDPSRRSWVRNPDVSDDERARWEARFRKHLAGMPSALTGDKLGVLVEWASEEQFLVEADDEARLARLRGDQ
jgi:CHAT domain